MDRESQQRGVTLVELLVSMFVFSVIVIMLVTFFNYFFDSYYFTFHETQSIDEAKYVVDKISSEIREAQTSEEGAYPLVVADDAEIAIFCDADDDGKVERVRYFLDGTQLKRGMIEPGNPPDVYLPANEVVQVVSDYIQNGANPVFYYYNGNWPGDVVNNPLGIAYRMLETRLVEVDLMVNTGPGTIEDVRISTKAMIRNLKTNY